MPGSARSTRTRSAFIPGASRPRAEGPGLLRPLDRRQAVAPDHARELEHALRDVRGQGATRGPGDLDAVPQERFAAGVDLSRVDDPREPPAGMPLGLGDEL